MNPLSINPFHSQWRPSLSDTVADDQLAALQAYLSETLVDVQLPTAVSIWPLAWGWWVVIGLSILLPISSFILIRYVQKKNQLKKQALGSLQQLTSNWSTSQDISDQQLQALSQWLRQICLTQIKQQSADNQDTSINVANLTQQQWRQHLLQASQYPIDESWLYVFSEGIYQPQQRWKEKLPNPSVKSAIKQLKAWAKQLHYDAASEFANKAEEDNHA